MSTSETNQANKEPPSAREVAEELPNQILQASESILHGDFQKEMRVSKGGKG